MDCSTDIAAAARRVAEHARSLPRSVVHAGVAAADLLALLPVLDAVGAEPGVDRVDQMARVIRNERQRLAQAARCGMCEPEDCFCEDRALARAAIALADAERAAEASSDLAKASFEIDRHAEEIGVRVTKRREEFRAAVREPKGRFKL